MGGRVCGPCDRVVLVVLCPLHSMVSVGACSTGGIGVL